METAVVWFREDLRLTDNPTIIDAVQAAQTVVPVYALDPAHCEQTRYGTRKTGDRRLRFLHECLEDLQSQLAARGGDLLVEVGAPRDVIPQVVDRYDADAVFTQTKPATEELEAEHAVRTELPASVAFERRWTHTLYHINDLPTPYHQIPDTFTTWRKAVEEGAEPRPPLSPPETVQTPSFDGEIPRLVDDGPPTDDRVVVPFPGGETAGQARVEEYIWTGDNLREYKQTRNGLLGADYSSKFSPWLARGCLSPRWLYAEVKRYEDERVANEDTYWLIFELAWRDFFQFQFVKHGGDFFTPTGIRDVDRDWRHDRTQFERWAAGETGVPFVDANMRELNQTGYMSNRGRQNVASFLVDVLEIDWRWGAAYFEEQLVDYDVASNWGNWAYQAGVGNDSRDRYFNVLSQANRYDSNAEYVTTWLPELAALPPGKAHRPWELTADEQAAHGVELGVDYPRPVVDIDAAYDRLQHRS